MCRRQILVELLIVSILFSSHLMFTNSISPESLSAQFYASVIVTSGICWFASSALQDFCRRRRHHWSVCVVLQGPHRLAHIYRTTGRAAKPARTMPQRKTISCSLEWVEMDLEQTHSYYGWISSMPLPVINRAKFSWNTHEVAVPQVMYPNSEIMKT